MMYDVDPKANDGASLVAQMQVLSRTDPIEFPHSLDVTTPLKLVFMFGSPWQIRLSLFGQRNVSL